MHAWNQCECLNKEHATLVEWGQTHFDRSRGMTTVGLYDPLNDI